MRSTRARCDRPCPEPSTTSRPPSTRCAPSARTCTTAGPQALRDLSERFDGVRPDQLRVPGRGAGRRPGGPGPRHPRRAGGVDPSGAAGARGPAPHRHAPPGGPRRHRHRALGARRPGRPLRPRRRRGPGQQRDHERRPRPGRRGAARWPWPARPSASNHGRLRRLPRTRPSSPRARCSGSRRSTPSAGPRPSRCSPTAPARRRRGAPGAGEVVCEPVNLVTGPGNIYVVAAKRLLKGLIGIDSEAGPTEIAILADDSADPVPRRRRPDQPVRARRPRGLGPGHRQRAARRRGRSRRWRRGSPRPSTTSASAPR